jgi:hypothetical protein
MDLKTVGGTSQEIKGKYALDIDNVIALSQPGQAGNGGAQ